jgi:hypothetical protein
MPRLLTVQNFQNGLRLKQRMKLQKVTTLEQLKSEGRRAKCI